MPVSIVSDPDWLLASWTDIRRDYLCEELLVLRVGEELVEVAICRVEIGKLLRLALIGHASCTRVFASGPHTAVAIGTGFARSSFLLYFLFECHGLRAAVEGYRLNTARLAFLRRGNLGSAVILGDGRLSLGKLHYRLELLRVFQIKGVLRLAERIWNHLGTRLFEVAAHRCVQAKL